MSQLVQLETYHPNCTLCSVCKLAAALGAAVELSPQRIHDSFLLVPGVVTTEFLDLRGGEVVEAKGIHPLLGQLRYNSKWLKLRILSFPSFIVLPRMSAVSLRSTKICTFMFASLSDSSGRIQAMHLSTFLMRTSETQIITSNHNTYQMSTLLWRRRLCWKMLGRSQVEDKTLTSSLSMPKLSLILSRLSVLSVAELSMNGTPWYVALSQLLWTDGTFLAFFLTSAIPFLEGRRRHYCNPEAKIEPGMRN